jgi:hypothetical protein
VSSEIPPLGTKIILIKRTLPNTVLELRSVFESKVSLSWSVSVVSIGVKDVFVLVSV